MKELVNIATVARRRLVALERAGALRPPDPSRNRLEALSGDREGQHSIRIDDQFRICFTWREGHAEEVEITEHYE